MGRVFQVESVECPNKRNIDSANVDQKLERLKGQWFHTEDALKLYLSSVFQSAGGITYGFSIDGRRTASKNKVAAEVYYGHNLRTPILRLTLIEACLKSDVIMGTKFQFWGIKL